MKILFATTNPAKVKFYATRLLEQGIEIVTLADLGIVEEVEETGDTPIENAQIKAQAYAKMSGLPTIALDEGLYFEGLDSTEQPGVHVRRVQGRRLNDEEMITHYLALVNRYGTAGCLAGTFVKGVAFVFEGQVVTFESAASRRFVNRKSTVIDPGYPLASIQIIPGVNKFKSELTRQEEKETMDVEQQPIFDFLKQVLKQMNPPAI
ncbi:non-canonical purine NTP pyrophosphatase [Enterococcus sp. LJL98]